MRVSLLVAIVTFVVPKLVVSVVLVVLVVLGVIVVVVVVVVKVIFGCFWLFLAIFSTAQALFWALDKGSQSTALVGNFKNQVQHLLL